MHKHLNDEVSEMHLPIFQFAQEVVFEGNVSTMLTCTRNGHDVRIYNIKIKVRGIKCSSLSFILLRKLLFFRDNVSTMLTCS